MSSGAFNSSSGEHEATFMHSEEPLHGLAEYLETYCQPDETGDIDRKLKRIRGELEKELGPQSISTAKGRRGSVVEDESALAQTIRALGRQIAFATLRSVGSATLSTGDSVSLSTSITTRRQAGGSVDLPALDASTDGKETDYSSLNGTPAPITLETPGGGGGPGSAPASALSPLSLVANTSPGSPPFGVVRRVQSSPGIHTRHDAPTVPPSPAAAPMSSRSPAGGAAHAVHSLSPRARSGTLRSELSGTLAPSGSGGSGTDRRTRELVRALGHMSRLYIDSVQRQWVLERRLVVADAEKVDAHDQLEIYKAAGHTMPRAKSPRGRRGGGQSIGVSFDLSSGTFETFDPRIAAAIMGARSRLRSSENSRALTPNASSGVHSPDKALSTMASSNQGSGLLHGHASTVDVTHGAAVRSLHASRTGSGVTMAQLAAQESFSSQHFHAIKNGGVHYRTTDHVAVDVNAGDGTSMINQYLVLGDLGQGAQGRVVLTVDTESGDTRAIKEIPRPKVDGPGIRSRVKNARAVSQLQREVAVMKKCRHKNVVALYEVIDDPDAHAMFLVMQYVEHGAVACQKTDGTVAPIAPARLASFARQLCAGLHYLHSHGVVHRDIKPENILLGQNDQVFLADFGISSLNDDEDNVPATLITEPTAAVISNDDAKSVSSESTDPGHGLHGASNQLGTLVYRSPELVQGAGSPAATDASDVWALGLSLYVLLYGRLPFPLRSAYQFLQHITDSDVEFPPTVPPSTDPATRTEPDTSAAMPDIPDQGNGLTPESSQAQSPDKNDSGDSPQLEYHSEWRELLSAMLDKNPSRRIRSDEAHRRAKALHVKYMELEMLRSIREADLSSAIVTRRRPPSPMSLPASGTNSNPHQQHRQHSAQTSDRASSPLSSRHASEVASSI